MRWPHKVAVGAVDVAVGDVQGLEIGTQWQWDTAINQTYNSLIKVLCSIASNNFYGGGGEIIMPMEIPTSASCRRGDCFSSYVLRYTLTLNTVMSQCFIILLCSNTTFISKVIYSPIHAQSNISVQWPSASSKPNYSLVKWKALYTFKRTDFFFPYGHFNWGLIRKSVIAATELKGRWKRHRKDHFCILESFTSAST